MASRNIKRAVYRKYHVIGTRSWCSRNGEEEERSLHPLVYLNYCVKVIFIFHLHRVFNTICLRRCFSPLVLTFGELIIEPVWFSPFCHRLSEKCLGLPYVQREGELFICTALGSEIHWEMFLFVVLTGPYVVLNCHISHDIFAVWKKAFYLFILLFSYSPIKNSPSVFYASTGAAEISQLPLLSLQAERNRALRRAKMMAWIGVGVGREGGLRALTSISF